jgi:hypothetical protein
VKAYTCPEVAYLRRRIPDAPLSVIAQELDRSPNALRQLAVKIGASSHKHRVARARKSAAERITPWTACADGSYRRDSWRITHLRDPFGAWECKVYWRGRVKAVFTGDTCLTGALKWVGEQQ